MAPSKNRQSKKTKDRKIPVSSRDDKPSEVQHLTGNEESNVDIFVDIEPKATTNLLVTEHNAPKPIIEEQQVAQTNQEDEHKISDHIAVNIEPDVTLPPPPQPLPPQDAQPDIQIPINQESSPDDDNVFDETTMSATVTRLTTPNGSEIFLIGTAHFSLQSVEDVRKVIRSNKPSSVIMELCKERAFMLNFDEQYLFEQNSKLSFETIKDAIVQKGIVQGLIYVLFIKMSASLTEKNGMAPGAEFRAGSIEAQKIPGCSVVLADRSLRTTIARAVRALNLWQKIKLMYQVLGSDFEITPEDVEKCKERDVLEQLLLELGSQFPGFKRVLLDERDIYLSHSIYKWAQNCETSLGPPRIVAIVGIGHVQGIIANWGKTTDEQIRALNVIPETSRTEVVVTKTVKYFTIAFVLYVGYCCLVPSSIQNTVNSKLFGG
uniref:TraB domain-containing protein n=1 Tax=Aceria tosichella TaxID=561515 RepID=A0A6G1SNJ5_9ACAR